MKRPLVADYLETHTFAELEEEHAVKARPCSKLQKFSLNYDQIKAKSDNPLTNQCRGMVIRPTWDVHAVGSGDGYLDAKISHIEVVAWPMNRFFNHGDTAAAELNWSDPELVIFEKLDGTMCVLYFDFLAGEWHVATRSIPEADLPIMNNGIGINHTFASLFKHALACTLKEVFGFEQVGADVHDDETLFDFFTAGLDKENTYVFELTTPLNRIVVRYDEYRVTLLAARKTSTGEEFNINELSEPWLLKCTSWASLNEPQRLVAFVNTADPSKIEGAVAMDSAFRRIKVKNAAWVMSSKAKDLVTVSRRNAVEAIINKSVDDIIPLVEKEIADELLSLQERLVSYCTSVDGRFGLMFTSSETKKDFALAVKELDDWPTPYFQLHRAWEEGNKPSMLEWLCSAYESGRLTSTSFDNILQQIDKMPVRTSA